MFHPACLSEKSTCDPVWAVKKTFKSPTHDGSNFCLATWMRGALESFSRSSAASHDADSRDRKANGHRPPFKLVTIGSLDLCPIVPWPGCLQPYTPHTTLHAKKNQRVNARRRPKLQGNSPRPLPRPRPVPPSVRGALGHLNSTSTCRPKSPNDLVVGSGGDEHKRVLLSIPHGTEACDASAVGQSLDALTPVTGEIPTVACIWFRPRRDYKSSNAFLCKVAP